MRFKKGDSIVVISGKDKGKTGIIKEVNKKNNKLVVENINMRTHHIKPTQQNPEGGIVKKEGPIDSSNVMLNIGGKNIEVSRIGFKIQKNKKGKYEKVRISKKNGEQL